MMLMNLKDTVDNPADELTRILAVLFIYFLIQQSDKRDALVVFNSK